ASAKKTCRESSVRFSVRILTARDWGCPRSGASPALTAGGATPLPPPAEAPPSRFGFRSNLASNYRYRNYVNFHGQLIILIFQRPGSARRRDAPVLSLSTQPSRRLECPLESLLARFDSLPVPALDQGAARKDAQSTGAG